MRLITKNRLIYFIVFDAVLIALAATAFVSRGPDGSGSEKLRIGHARMKISSSAFTQDGIIPAEYTCDGPGTPPPLEWSDVPAGTKSLVLMVDDPDAPSGTWTHWTAWNISPDASGTESGQLPAGTVQGITSSGEMGWHAPCPPFGMHRYFFKLYALNARLELTASATVTDLERAIERGVLDKAGLIGRYERRNQ